MLLSSELRARDGNTVERQAGLLMRNWQGRAALVLVLAVMIALASEPHGLFVALTCA